MKEKTKTINVTPSWKSLYPLFKEWIMTGQKSQKEHVCEELKKLCELADIYNQSHTDEG